MRPVAAVWPTHRLLIPMLFALYPGALVPIWAEQCLWLTARTVIGDINYLCSELASWETESNTIEAKVDWQRQPHYPEREIHRGRDPCAGTGQQKGVWDFYWKYAGALSPGRHEKKSTDGSLLTAVLFFSCLCGASRAADNRFLIIGCAWTEMTEAVCKSLLTAVPGQLEIMRQHYDMILYKLNKIYEIW